MSKKENTHSALYLLDNDSLVNALREGDFTIKNMTFDETRAVLDTFEKDQIHVGFSNTHIEQVIFGYLGISKKAYDYREINKLEVGQEALVFKLYVTESETQPIIYQDGIEAKKIENIYVYCQYVSRIK